MKNIFFHLIMLQCFFSFWFIRSGIIGNSWGVFSNLAFVILNPQPTWPFQYVRDWCGGDREFSKLVALKLSALSPCTPPLMLKYIQNISKYVKTSCPDKYWSYNINEILIFLFCVDSTKIKYSQNISWSRVPFLAASALNQQPYILHILSAIIGKL